jgi:hypothetical protein
MFKILKTEDTSIKTNAIENSKLHRHALLEQHETYDPTMLLFL